MLIVTLEFAKIGPYVSRQSLGVDVVRTRVVSGRIVQMATGPTSIVILPARIWKLVKLYR